MPMHTLVGAAAATVSEPTGCGAALVRVSAPTGCGRPGESVGADRLRRRRGRSVRPAAPEDIGDALDWLRPPHRILGAFQPGVSAVDQPDIHSDLGQHAQPRAAQLGDEAGVLADRDLLKAGALPQRFPVAERGAVDPGRTTAWVDIFPAAPGDGIEEQDAVEPAEIGAAVDDLGDLPAEPPRGVPVVIVPVRDDLSVRRGA
jgi:hypothetical protein